jgi:hypothetical protein
VRIFRIMQFFVAAFLVVVPFASVPAHAQSPSPTTAAKTPSKPTPRTPDGRPDLSGVWGGPSSLQNIGKDLPGKQLPYTDAGREAYQNNLTKVIDPSAVCIIQGVPRADISGQPFEIFQRADRVAFLYERDTNWRIIPADGRKHPKDPDPSFFGNAIGEWDGDTFVVDSIAFKGEKIWADETAHAQSDALHLIERFTRPDFDHLKVEITIDDPKYYTRTFTYNRQFKLLPYELDEQACDENNVDGSHMGPGLGTKDGTRGFDRPAPTPKPGPAGPSSANQ